MFALPDSKPMQVDKAGQRVRQMFGEITPRYDLLNHLLSLNADRYWRWATTRCVPAASSERPPALADAPILDLCTGTGDLALSYWRRSNPSIRVIGVDFCRPMLVRAAEKAHAAGADGQLRFVEADAQRLPFASDRFQIVCVAFGLRNVSDTSAGLTEMVRVCAPGGTVAVLEFSMPRWPLLRGAYGFYFRRVLPLLGQALARNRHGAYNYLPASVLEFPQGAAMVRLMQEHRLGEVTARPLTLGVATLYTGTKPFCQPAPRPALDPSREHRELV